MLLPQGYTFRKLKLTDYDNQYLETLKVLTTVGEISKKNSLNCIIIGLHCHLFIIHM